MTLALQLVLVDTGILRAKQENVPFSRGDPLTALLARRIQAHSALSAFILLVLINVPIVALAFVYNLWADQGNRSGLLHDYSWWLLQVTSVLATFTFFLWLPHGVLQVLEGLRANQVIVLKPPQEKSAETYETFVKDFDASYSNPLWLGICVAFTLVVMATLVVPRHLTYLTWAQSNAVIFAYTETFWFLFFLLAALNLLRVFIAIVWFNRLFRTFQIDLKVLHPDRAGGLAPLGRFSIRVAYVIAAYGVALVVILLAESYHLTGHFQGISPTPSLQGLTLLYLIVAPLVFFAPIGSAHAAMDAAKSKALMQISRQFEADFARMQSLLDSNSEELKGALEKIEHLERVYDLTSRFPVWPFNTGSVVRFFSVISSPLLLFVASNVIAIVIKH